MRTVSIHALTWPALSSLVLCCLQAPKGHQVALTLCRLEADSVVQGMCGLRGKAEGLGLSRGKVPVLMPALALGLGLGLR